MQQQQNNALKILRTGSPNSVVYSCIGLFRFGGKGIFWSSGTCFNFAGIPEGISGLIDLTGLLPLFKEYAKLFRLALEADNGMTRNENKTKI